MKKPRKQKIQVTLPDPLPAARWTDSQIEDYLRKGQKERELRDLMGDAMYEELSVLVPRASRRAKGPRVLILPGILGSKLAVKKGAGQNLIWMDPIGIAMGEMKLLISNGTPGNVAAVGALTMTYGKLRWRLCDEGFDAEYYHYDWRLGFDLLGKQLADHVAHKEKGPVFLVGHSMGGLVCRAALGAGGLAKDKVKRLVMLGTPNQGSFAPALVYTNQHGMTKTLAALDMTHSAEELIGEVFRTWDGLTQMLPQQQVWKDLDLYDAAAWPNARLRPERDALRRAVQIQKRVFIEAQANFHLIAGVNKETVVSLRAESGGWVPVQSNEGDGTVPLAFAQLPHLDTRYVSGGEHGSLPGRKDVAKAVMDLFNRGTTDALPSTWALKRAASPASGEFTRAALLQKADANGKVPLERWTNEELRRIASDFTDVPPVDPSSVVSAPGLQAYKPRFNPPLRLQRANARTLEIVVAEGDLAEVNARACVLGMFQQVTPMGAALDLDRRLDGVITEFTQRRMFCATVGETSILPVGRRELRMDYVVFAGMGSFDQFSVDILDQVAENVARTLARTHVEEFATLVWATSSGVELEEALTRLLRGFLIGLADADPKQKFRRLIFCERDPVRVQRIRDCLLRLAGTEIFATTDVRFSEEKLSPPPPLRGTVPAMAPDEAIYLTVRQQGAVNKRRTWEASLLTAGSKATVFKDVAQFLEGDLKAVLQKIPAAGFTQNQMEAFGLELAETVLPASIRSALVEFKDKPLVVVHDGPTSLVPWETLALSHGKRIRPALEGGMTRRYISNGGSIAKWLEERRLEARLRVLLIVNPTEDLEGAEAEGARLQEAFKKDGRVELTVLRGLEASKARVLQELSGGRHDLMHYAGHAHFLPGQPGRAGLLCAQAEELTGNDLRTVGALPALIFLNACESGRIRKRGKKKRNEPLIVMERLLQETSVAETLLQGGVGNLLATYWPVGDAGAEKFATSFYQGILTGATLGQSLVEARRVLAQGGLSDWADYMLFGSANFKLKISE